MCKNVPQASKSFMATFVFSCQDLFRNEIVRLLHCSRNNPSFQTCALAGEQTRSETVGIVQEFKQFAIKGNVMDLAIGVIIGGAFGKIVDSLVNDIIMPVVGLVFGKLDFSSLFVVLGTVPEGVSRTLADLKKAGVPVFAYGSFITVAVNFLILAFVIFVMVKQINRLRRETPAPVAAPVATPEDIVLLREIRDSLRVPPLH